MKSWIVVGRLRWGATGEADDVDVILKLREFEGM